MKITFALVFTLCFAIFSSSASAQCENGVCQLVPKVASVAVNAIQKIVPVSFANESEYFPASEPMTFTDECLPAQQAVAASAPMRTPVRTILRARPLQRLFRCR